MSKYLKHSTHGQIEHLFNCAIADLEGILPEHDPSGDREHPAWKTLDDMKDMVKRMNNEFVLFTWDVEDVQTQDNGEHLNDEQARKVLERCFDEHDANVGMNHETIQMVIDIMEGEL